MVSLTLRSFAAMLVLIASSACAQTSSAQRPQTVDEIVSSEGSLASGPVAVKGYLRFGDDSRNLWADRKAYLTVKNGDVGPDDPAWNRCITIYDIGRWRQQLLSNNNSYVIVRGVIERHPTKPGEITTSSCSDLGISIENLVKARLKD